MKKIYEGKIILDQTDTEEEAYRRGYHQGYCAAKNTDVSEEEIRIWRHGSDNVAPPGSSMAGFKF